jgi:hypothetical protein
VLAPLFPHAVYYCWRVQTYTHGLPVLFLGRVFLRERYERAMFIGVPIRGVCISLGGKHTRETPRLLLLLRLSRGSPHLAPDLIDALRRRRVGGNHERKSQAGALGDAVQEVTEVPNHERPPRNWQA